MHTEDRMIVELEIFSMEKLVLNLSGKLEQVRKSSSCQPFHWPLLISPAGSTKIREKLAANEITKP